MVFVYEEDFMKQYDVIVIGAGSGNIVLDAALRQGLKCA